MARLLSQNEAGPSTEGPPSAAPNHNPFFHFTASQPRLRQPNKAPAGELVVPSHTAIRQMTSRGIGPANPRAGAAHLRRGKPSDPDRPTF
jgi:hypothetical protein